MQARSVVALGGLALVLASACLLERGGRADADADLDADADTDGDIDADGDVDGDLDGDADSELDGDLEADGDEDADRPPTVRIDEVDPPTGYASGWALDPRGERLVRILLVGPDRSAAIRVWFGETELVSGCATDASESCVANQGQEHGTSRVELTVRYPPAPRVGPERVRVEADGVRAEWEGFEYRALPISLGAEAEIAAPFSSVEALATGCFAAPSALACRTEQVALGGHDPVLLRGRLALLSAGARGSSTVSGLSGSPATGLEALVPLQVAGRPDFRPELAALGLSNLYFYSYDLGGEAFGSAGAADCTVFVGLRGIGAGDLIPATPGDEVLAVDLEVGRWDFQVLPTLPGACAPGSAEASHPAPVLGLPAGRRIVPVVADLDGDGVADGFVPLPDEAGAPLLLALWGDGAGGFDEVTPHALEDACGLPGDAALVSVAEDGGRSPLALVVGCTESAELQVLLVGPGRTLIPAEPQATGLGGSSSDLVVAGSLNGDPMSDLVVAGRGGRRASVLLGRGEPSAEGSLFERPSPALAPDFDIRSGAVGDLDGDRLGEVVLGGTATLLGSVQVAWPTPVAD